MRRRVNQRMRQVEQAIAAMPIREDVLKRSFEQFCKVGELPENHRLATEVLRQALRGKKLPWDKEPPRKLDPCEDISELVAALRKLGPPSSHPPIRKHLFNEALSDQEPIRQAARGLLKHAVAHGADVTRADFLADRSLPEHGSVAMHLLGFPQCLAKPPYVEQAQRLIARYAALRSKINFHEPSWFDPIGDAIREFRATGDLSDQEIPRECAIADSELLALMTHYLGVGDAKLLAAFDAAATASDAARPGALTTLQELMREGRLFYVVD